MELDQQEEVADRRRLEALEQEIQERKYREKELLKVMEQRQARMRHQTAAIDWQKATETRLENQRQNALEQIRIAEEQIADLPNATGYSYTGVYTRSLKSVLVLPPQKAKTSKIKKIDVGDLFFRSPALWSSQNVFGPPTAVAWSLILRTGSLLISLLAGTLPNKA